MEHVQTLYDALETSIALHPQVIPHTPQSSSPSLPGLLLPLICAICRKFRTSSWTRLLQAPFLGERTVTAQGEAGPYEWMTFKEVWSGLTVRRMQIKPCVTGSLSLCTVDPDVICIDEHIDDNLARSAFAVPAQDWPAEAHLPLHWTSCFIVFFVCFLILCWDGWTPQFGEARTATGSGLLHYGVEQHQTIGIYSVNCTAWVMMAEACNAYSLVSVPLYDTLGPDAVKCGPCSLQEHKTRMKSMLPASCSLSVI